MFNFYQNNKDKIIKKTITCNKTKVLRIGSKFNNKIVQYENKVFHSILEKNCYVAIKKQCILKDLILRLQVPFSLVRNYKYIADFVISSPFQNKMLILDAKGVITDTFKLKSAIMEQNNNPVICVKTPSEAVKKINDFFK